SAISPGKAAIRPALPTRGFACRDHGPATFRRLGQYPSTPDTRLDGPVHWQSNHADVERALQLRAPALPILELFNFRSSGANVLLPGPAISRPAMPDLAASPG